MEKRQLGTSGLQVSTLGLGCNNFGGRLDEAQSIAVIEKALDLGVTLIDTADVYPMTTTGTSEEIIGKALGKARADVVLATKFGMDMGNERHGGSRHYIMAAVEDSLRRLRTDWIDLYYLHQPDPRTPIEETLRALDDLVRQGKVRYIGCSNFAGWRTVEATYLARELGTNAFICSQEHYSLLAREVEREVVPALEAYGLGLLPFFPLASGLLTGKYRAGGAADGRLSYTERLANTFLTERNLELVERFAGFCEARGKSLTDLAFAWLLAQKTVPSVIAGASNDEQLEQNLKAVEWTLSAEDLAEIERLGSED
ncbi:MAG: aldo/keto reductase [Alphaproteobacteria bacterium]|nr:aldo/keto reductase [Alphaproteobacteria bacterium]